MYSIRVYVITHLILSLWSIRKKTLIGGSTHSYKYPEEAETIIQPLPPTSTRWRNVETPWKHRTLCHNDGTQVDLRVSNSVIIILFW
jgi:hypothetical protein